MSIAHGLEYWVSADLSHRFLNAKIGSYRPEPGQATNGLRTQVCHSSILSPGIQMRTKAQPGFCQVGEDGKGTEPCIGNGLQKGGEVVR